MTAEEYQQEIERLKQLLKTERADYKRMKHYNRKLQNKFVVVKALLKTRDQYIENQERLNDGN